SQTSRGTNHLIQEGAKLVRCATDVLEELNLTQAVLQVALKEALPATDTESRLLKNLNAEPTHIDEVCRSSGLPIAQVSATLSMMELKGMVKQVAAMSYVLAREFREEYRARVE
ncbi:MAG: DNA-protecting protein DprA, partial [Chloroflexota bacterium]